MSDKYVSFKRLLFSDYEYPTSFKLNKILDLLENTRLINGPYSITKYSQDSSTSFTVRLNEDITLIGGIYQKEQAIVYYTNRKFIVYYETREDETGDYACCNNVELKLTDGQLLATLTSGTNIYNNGVNVSDIDGNALYCIRASG